MIKLNPRGHFRENRCRGYSGYGTFVTRLVRDFGCGVRHEVFCVLRLCDSALVSKYIYRAYPFIFRDVSQKDNKIVPGQSHS